jgi:kynurenine formamidase
MDYIWLSHVIENATPLYGGQKDAIRIEPDKSMAAGDSCNTSTIRMPAHAGTHVDAPRHFVAAGEAIDEISAKTWVFQYPAVVTLEVSPGQIITPEDIGAAQLPQETDICLFKTAFEDYRNSDIYWEKGPGIAPEMAAFLLGRCPDLRAIGMDFISISSLQARETGREAHRTFLGKDILIIEDMKLGEIVDERVLNEVICLPLRIFKGDGAPCSVIGAIR